MSPPPEAHPTISTTALGGGPAGSPIEDTAHLSDGNDPTGTITFRVYGPRDSDCAGIPAGSSTVTVSGNGDYRSLPFTPTRAGTYHWVAEYSGDDHNHPAGPTACDDPAESVTVSRAHPRASHGGARRSSRSAAPPATAAILAGGSEPLGKITFRLYGPGDRTCSAAPVFTAQQIVVGNGSYRSPRFEPQADRRRICGPPPIRETRTITRPRPVATTAASGPWCCRAARCSRRPRVRRPT